MVNDYIFHGDPSEETSVLIDGVRLADLGVHLLADSEEPILPNVRTQSVVIPGRHGAYDFGSYFEPRLLTLSCGINNQASLYHVQALVRKFSELFLDQYGRPKEVTVEYEYDLGKQYTAKLASEVSINRIVRAGLFQVPLIAYDPYAYSTFTSDEVTWGSEEIFFTNTQYTLGHENIGVAGVDVSAPTSFGIYVTGYAVKPIIEVEGSADSLTLETGGQEIEFPTFNNVKWSIDCEKYLVKKDGNNAFGEIQLRNFVLNEGSNGINVSGSGLDVNIKVRFRDKFL